MVCKKCGSSIPEGTLFCSQCGSPVETEKNNNVASQKKGNKKVILGIFAFAVVFLVIIVSVFVSNNSATKYMRNAIDTKEAFVINDVYAQAYSDSELLEKYDELIADELNEMIDGVNSYNFYEAASVNGANALLDYLQTNWGTICSYYSDGYDECIAASISASNSAKWEELNRLLESKYDYCTGVYNYTNGNYESAVSSFSCVIETDSNFSDAETYISECLTKYIDTTYSQAQKLIDGGDISGGIDLLSSAKEYIDSRGFNSEKLNNIINDTLSKYAEQYANKAEESFNSHDIDSAIGNIEVAIELQPDNADYNSKHNYYLQFKPFELHNKNNILEWDTHYGSLEQVDSITSNENIEYHNVLELGCSDDEDAFNNTVAAIYDLDGKYDTVSGTLFIANYYKNSNCISYIKLYGDGKLLYTSECMTSGSKAEDFELDVKDVHELRLEYYGKIWSIVDRDCYIYISDFVAQKAFPQ